MDFSRRKSKRITVGNKAIGGDEKITIQSMLNFPSGDVDGNIKQAKELERAGCDIIRVAIPKEQDVFLISCLKEKVSTPIVADIHFGPELVSECIKAGADKIRINPGNIGGIRGIEIAVKACSNTKIPMRIGVNGGSLEKKILQKFGGPTPEAMVESALCCIADFESLGFFNMIVSLKTPNVRTTVKAYEIFSEKSDYPLHLGVTESGTKKNGIISSAIGIGALLIRGIGDTIRVSLSTTPLDEIETGIAILKNLNLYDKKYVKVISCPTCGRTSIDVIGLAEEIEKITKNTEKNIKIAIMGCPVNGPGEAADCNLCIIGANGEGIIFKDGIMVKKIPKNKIIDELIREIERY
jgi:(E)-4-hydroxy-3-methylbut-2-enyl-diphosphate synthase